LVGQLYRGACYLSVTWLVRYIVASVICRLIDWSVKSWQISFFGSLFSICHFALFHLSIAFFVGRITSYCYPFGIFKLFYWLVSYIMAFVIFPLADWLAISLCLLFSGWLIG
jgi:hypothetical protein